VCLHNFGLNCLKVQDAITPELVAKCMYRHYIDCLPTCPPTWSSEATVRLLQNCLCEFLAIDPGMQYKITFVGIRQVRMSSPIVSSVCFNLLHSFRV
jgi:hypothetical protein